MRKLKLLIAACALMAGTSATLAQDAGTYYIQNVSNGKWLGPGNKWGTQASVLNHADYWKLAKITVGIYTLESVVSNGGSNYYLNGTYCDGGATNFIFYAVDGKANTYTIKNSTFDMLTTNGTTVDVSGNDATATASQWKLWSEADMAAGMAAATVENPFDATYLIKDHDLGRNNRDYSAWSNTGATAPKSNAGNSETTIYSIEAYCKTFDVNQTLTNVPNGVYAVRVNGFYRQDGSDANLPYVYANDSQTTLPVRTGTENDMQSAAVSFVAGNYLSEPAYVQVTDGTLKVGVKTEGTSCWTIVKNFHLAYYGNVTVAEVLLAEYVKAYNEAMAEAQAFTEESMFADAWTALQSAVSSNTLNLSSVTQEQLETATANLRAANTAATAAVKAKTCYDSAVTLINGGTNVDLTSIVVNASFEEGNLNGWTTVNGGAPANNNNWSKVGTWYVERWTSNGDTQNHLSDGTLTHDALVLPAGLYTITAKAQNQEQKNGVAGTGYFLYANDEKVEITGTNTYSTSVLLADKSELVIKFALEGCTGNWVSCDDITLTYVGENFPAYTLVEGKMNAEVAAAQTAADDAFQASKTVANYNAVVAAISAAEASVAAYSAAAQAISDAKALKDAHNFASSTATATFADAIATIENSYTEGTLSDDAANNAATTLGVAVTGWHAGNNNAAVVYMRDGFGLGEFDVDLHVNSWSIEGANDGSNFVVPFYEYWTNAENKLAEKTWTGTVTGLENGLYKVSVWTRVQAQNVEGASAASATGITIDVNGGTAIDVTNGEQIGESLFQMDSYEAEGLVKDGKLSLNINVAADNNISWLSFKNVKYTKVRDLTPEEMLVAPAYEPANASEGYIEWTTSDASVATVENGVVTAISTGTATITATSTINNEVSASVTVNVAFPESEFASTQTIVNDNDTRSTLTLGANLIKNGSFEYPTNPVFGWTTGTGSVNAMNAANFNIVPEGAFNGNQYLQATASKGGADEHSINTSWPIEKGKKYVFSFMIKANKQCTTDLNYIGVSITNAKGNEASDKVPGVKFDTPAYGTEWQEIKHVFENDAENGYSWLVFNSRWLANQQSFDNFYLCEVIDETTTDQVTDEEAAALLATVPTGKMNAETLTALTTAKEAFEANKSIANSKALSAAITAAEASVTAYAPLGAAIAKIDAALDAATTATASADDYDAVKTAYNNGTIADADIMTNVVAAYNAVIPVIKSQTAAQADFTLAIQNQSFEYGDMTGWSAVSSSDTGVRETSNATYAAAGSDGYYLFNTWWQGVPVSQTISDLPNGEYTLRASVASDGATIYLVANGEHNDGTETYAETNIEEQQYGKDTFQDATITFLVKQGSVTIAAVGGAGGDAGVHKDYVEEGYWWYKADNFRLVKNRDLTPEEEFVAADEADYEHLNGVLAKYALGFEAGEFAPYNNLTLVQAVAAAKAIDQTAVNSKEDVQAAAEAITSAGGIANETEVNAVYDGTFAVAAANGAPAGWTMSNNTLGGDYHSRVFNGDERLSEFNETNSALFIRFDGTNSDRGSQYFYGNTEGYTMPLKANTYYRVTVDFAGWGSTGKTLRMNLKGPDGFAKSQEYKHEHKADTESGYTPQQFNIVFQTGNTEGNYVIGFQCPGNDNNKHNAVISNLRLFTEPESSATLAVTDAKYGTFIAPFAVEIPNGVTAYTIESSNGNELVLTEVESDDIAANTPVVVFSESEVNEVFNGYSLAIKDSYTVGWLTGTYKNIDAPDGSYILQNHEGKVGFYQVDSSVATPKVRANRAYLTAPADAAGARAFFFDGGETTGISAIEALANGDAQIYNVNGVQQPRLMKGLNIIVTKDGKTHKVMVK